MKQVLQHAFDESDVGAYERRLRRDCACQPHALFLGLQLEFVQHIVRQFRELDRFWVDSRILCIEFCKLEQFGYQCGEPLALPGRNFKVIAQFLA